MNANYTVPSVRMNERPDGYDIRFTIPGIARENVSLDIEGRSLVLKTHANRQKPAGFRAVTSEFEISDYAASVDLPELADPSTLKATLANGLLEIAVAKRPETQARRIEIG